MAATLTRRKRKPRRPSVAARLAAWLERSRAAGERAQQWDLGVTIAAELEQLSTTDPDAAWFLVEALEAGCRLARLKGMAPPSSAPASAPQITRALSEAPAAPELNHHVKGGAPA